MKSNIIGLKDLRENMNVYISQINKGDSFVVVKKSKPIFKISPPLDDENWEEIADFTRIKKGGVRIEEIISRL